jgi:PPP family 3-phenylpropionic acid transporter
MSKRKPVKFQFAFIQLTFWCSWCAFTSFSALLFKNKGLYESEIGFALALNTCGGIAGLFLWGYLCDRFMTIKKNFIIANFIIWASILSFLFFKTTLPILLMMFVLGFAQVPQPSILDTWLLKKLPGSEEEYGHIRLWASLGFAVFALVFGWLIKNFGFSVMFYGASFFILLTILIAFRMSDADREREPGNSLGKSFKKLLTNKEYLFFITVCFIIGLAFRTIHLFLPLIIDKVGGNPGDLGLTYFVGLISEIPVLLLSRKLTKKLKSNILIFISVLLFIIHFIILLIAQTSLLVIISMISQGFAFGNYLPSLRLFVYENAPENLRTSAQTIADAVCSSLTAVIGSAAGGVIVQNYGIKILLTIGLGLLIAASAILMINILLTRRKNKF